ncbi:acetaldehyde dehydrogenase (acetylating) [Desulfosporosinus metallidurans]|uniref:Alcohol dehydrogenase n=1 Tax=Desulfosporosinus metallidurans TaxID=1888891 RepID=A0A1Q8QEH2_9FIRM|nr:acetaldehyde dehydrogenase (acetylating) [Desulfosporosinus metallidurans]OLN25759.1 Alcohol dehydrogenase [Desulfosporosinus metallidurans]
MELDRDLCSLQEARNLVRAARKAQEALMNFTQEQVDHIIDMMREAGEANAARLAMMAVSETGMGNYADKCFKNYFASRTVYDSIKSMKTVGIIREDREHKIWEIAEPVGVIAGIVPTTNPTSTVIYKAMIALKSRNAIVFSPHPSAVRCTNEAAKIMHQAAVAAGAPEGVIGCILNVSMGATTELMKHPSVAMILATGGSALVKAAYSSGKPALGVGPGNVPAFVERSADLPKAAEYIVMGKTFDNGTICASEQAIVAEECIADELIGHLKRNGAHFLDPEDVQKVSKVVMLAKGGVNPKVVGKDPKFIAQLAGISIPEQTKCLIAPLSGVGPQWPLSYEKLTTVLGFYRVADWHEGCERCFQLLEAGGVGHSLAIHSQNEEVIREFALKKPVNRILVNTPAAMGGVGATTGLSPSFTLGCGTWAGSSVSENVTPLHLLNIKRVAWHLGIPERKPVEPMNVAGAGATEGVQNSTLSTQVDANMVQEIINQVMQHLNGMKC